MTDYKIDLSPFARDLLPISIECKSRKLIGFYKWYQQAKSNSNDREPVLIIKQDRSKPLVIIDLDYYLNLEGKRILYEHS